MSDARSDDELLRAVGLGDREAFEVYYRNNAPWLEPRLRRRCADEDVVLDVLQETFLAVWQASGSYRGSGQSAGSRNRQPPLPTAHDVPLCAVHRYGR